MIEKIQNQDASGSPHPKYFSVRIGKSVLIDRPVEEVYGFWRNFRNIPRVFPHVDSVAVLDEKRTHWKLKGPLGRDVQWDAEITSDRRNEFISWRAMEPADLDNAGSVQFVSIRDGKSTEVRVTFAYNPPGGKLGRGLAMLFGAEPSQEIEKDLQTLKKILEQGEFPFTGKESSKNQRSHS